MENCKICFNNFQDSPDVIVLCEHQNGFVHLGCCKDRCSRDGRPCMHCVSQYFKTS